MMKLLVLVLGILATAQSKVTYEGQSVVRAEYSPSSRPWINQILKLAKPNVWRDSHGVIELMMDNEKNEKLLTLMKKKDIKASVMIQDVQKAIDEQMEPSKNYQKKSGKAIDNTVYREYSQLMAELDQLEADFPSLASSYVAGTTIEGRSIRVEKISSGGADSRPAIWIDCGIHAREWVAHASCMYFLDQLTSLYGSDTAITTLVDTYDFHIMPVVNPDGYVYTWTGERVWRKNRHVFDVCYGVDCNRNFDSNFGGPGASDIACSDTYHGETAFSEAESSAIRSASSALGSRLKAFFTIHSYSQLWMTPYGYDSTLPTDYTEMLRVSKVGVEALEAVHGTQYDYGNIADIIYVASGGSTDWVYDALGVVYAFALELRDTGTFGFLLPANQIEPTAEETWAGITASINAFA